MEAPDYYPEVDPFEDMDVDNLFDEPVMPQNEKQIVPKPPTYEESLKDLLEGNKEIYVDPQYFPEYEDELPPEYDEDEIDYALDADDEVSEILEDVGIDDYDVVQMKLDQPEMTPKKTKNYLNKILEKAKYKRRQLKGFKANVTKEYNRGTISEAERQIKNKRISNARVALNDYINHYESKAKTIKGSGIRKNQKGGNVIFFNDVKQLLKKLELIIGSINAGNTSVKMRNMGVAILDTLLKRTSEYLQRYELVRFQLDDVIRVPANGQHQLKNGYKFTINDRSSFYDWYNAYFEVQFQVQMLADGATTGANRITVINGAHSLIDHMMIKSAGKIVYDTDNLHKVTFVKNLLEYSDDFSRSVAKNSLWYLDTDHRIANANQNAGFEARRLLTTGLNDVNVVIPLNRYSFFEELEGRMLLPMQLQFNIQLQNDAELLKKADDVADGRVVLNRFLLWVPKLTPKDSLYDKFVSSFLVKNTWTYMREMYEVSAPTNSSGFFQISSSIDNVKAIFVYLQRAKSNNADENPYEFDTFNINLDRGNGSYLTTCRLEYGNGVFYPETEYDSESKVRIFNDLMSYGMRKNDYNSGTQLNLANYNSLYPIIFFDLSYQAERVTRDPKQLIFRYKLNANSAEDSPFNVHAIVLYDETIVIDKNTESMNSKKVKAKNGRLMEKSNCYICGKKKSKFVKSQSGGALARYKGPSTTDKIAYVASNFVTPSPSFASMARLLAGQALKGVKDNVDYYRKGKGIDIHKAILKVAPKKGFVLPGHRYTGPGNPLEKQVKWDQKTGKILEIYEKPTGKTDAVSMQHDVDYSVCANKSSKDQVKCKNEADRKMVKSLDAIPWKDRQWGHALARNIIADLNNEDIQGSFYEPELLKAKQDVFRIDKVIRRDYKKKQALVKWKGYSDDFNSWIPIKDLKDI
ncbi:hypothetical protein ACROYT_G008497 [Oculina patagonica]